MAQHSRPHSHPHGHGDHDHHGMLTELLDLDAEVLGPYIDEVIEWIEQFAPTRPRTVVDIGAGTGTASLALARCFDTAQVLAVDKSEPMLERIREAARAQGLSDRLSAVQADLDEAWPQFGWIDVACASSSLHEVADPDHVLRDLYAALNPGGLVAIVEMDSLPRFLPDDVSLGRPGLQSRCHEALAQSDWNAHPDWLPHLERAGFEMAGVRSFATEAGPTSSGTGRWAHANLRHIRPILDGRLGVNDLDVLDRLLAEDTEESLLHRNDLTVGITRTVWAARRGTGSTAP